MMLILVDRTRPEFLLKEEGEEVGAPEDFLERLLELDLIEKTTPAAPAREAQPAAAPEANEFERFRAAKDFMNATIVDALGIRSFFFTLKLECAGKLADLRALADAYRQALAKAEDAAKADVFAKRLRDMLR